MNRNRLSFIIATILIVIDIAFILLTTYAYFTVDIEGESKDIVLETFNENTNIIFNDTSNVSMVNAYTGEDIVKTFTIENTSNFPIYYDINIANVTNNFEYMNDLVYTLESDNNGAYRETSIMPEKDSVISSYILIKPHVKQSYKMTITFLKTDTDQSKNMNKTYSSNISITPSKNINVGELIYKDNTLGKLIVDSLNNNKEDIEGVFYTNSSINGVTTYYYKGSNILKNNLILDNKCYKILRTTEDFGIRIIYNGEYIDNKCSEEKIIETKSVFNNKSNYNAYVGYMYGDASSNNYKSEHNNINSSIIKNNTEKWYTDNFKNNNLISNTSIYCNNRKTSEFKDSGVLYTTLGYSNNNTGYIDSNMLSPSFDCIQNEDKFSVLEPGNQALNNPVGLVTLDELLYAGVSDENTENFLYSTDSYYTMTPAYYNGSDAYNFSIINGKISKTKVNESLGIRPVITLNKDTKIKSGDGSEMSPFRIN